MPGNAPSLAARWAVQAVARAGSIGIIGVYSPEFDAYPIGQAMSKNLTLRMENCNHRRYIPRLLAGELAANPGLDADEQRLDEVLAANLCRCTGYVGIRRAAQRAARAMRDDPPSYPSLPPEPGRRPRQAC